MSIETLNVDKAQKEVTVTNMELDKKGMEDTKVEEIKVEGQKVIEGEIKPGESAIHDGRDGDPELVNFLMDDKDKYIKVEIHADIVDGKPVISDTGKYLIWAKFLRPGWKLNNLIDSKKLTITTEGNVVVDAKFNTTVIKYLLKEWNLPLQIVFGVDLDENEEIKNIDTITGLNGIHPIILNELLLLAKERI